MAVNENIKKGAYYRHCTGFDPEGNPIYTRVSFWTDADDVKFEDGTKLSNAISELTTNINKLEGVALVGTLIANEEELVFTDSRIKTDNTVKYRYYTNVYSVSPREVNLLEGQMTLKFRKQGTNILVRVEIMDI